MGVWMAVGDGLGGGAVVLWVCLDGWNGRCCDGWGCLLVVECVSVGGCGGVQNNVACL